MYVKIVLPEQLWTQVAINKTFEVVMDKDYKRNLLFRVVRNGKLTNRTIRSSECEKIYTYPVYYKDYKRKSSVFV